MCAGLLDDYYVSVNVGTAGAGFAPLIEAAPAKVDSLIMRSKKNICVICAGINNLYYTGTAYDAQDVYDYYVQYVSERKAAGWYKVLVTTLTPVDPSRTDPDTDPNYETVRQSLNTMLKNDYAGADGVIDIGGHEIIGNVANTTNETYFRDGLHLTLEGYTIWANLAAEAIGLLP